MMNFFEQMVLGQLAVDTPVVIGLGGLISVLTALVVAVWRAANRVRDMTDALERVWTFQEQQMFAIEMERENRSKGNKVYVPDVMAVRERRIRAGN